jgi:hypothetical protein
MTFKDRAREFLVSVIADPRSQAALKKVTREIIAEQVMPLLPIAVGAATSEAMDQVAKRFPGADKAIETAVDTVQVANAARHKLNEMIHDFDIGIAPIDDIMDIWRPKG